VLAVAKVYNGEDSDYSLAAPAHASLPAKLPRGDLGQYPSALLKRCWEHFMDCGNLKARARSGRPVHIRDKDDVIRQAARLPQCSTL